MAEKSYNKTIIDFNFGRHKDLYTLKSDIHLGLAASVRVDTSLCLLYLIEVNNCIILTLSVSFMYMSLQLISLLMDYLLSDFRFFTQSCSLNKTLQNYISLKVTRANRTFDRIDTADNERTCRLVSFVMLPTMRYPHWTHISS